LHTPTFCIEYQGSDRLLFYCRRPGQLTYLRAAFVREASIRRLRRLVNGVAQHWRGRLCVTRRGWVCYVPPWPFYLNGRQSDGGGVS